MSGAHDESHRPDRVFLRKTPDRRNVVDPERRSWQPLLYLAARRHRGLVVKRARGSDACFDGGVGARLQPHGQGAGRRASRAATGPYWRTVHALPQEFLSPLFDEVVPCREPVTILQQLDYAHERIFGGPVVVQYNNRRRQRS